MTHTFTNGACKCGMLESTFRADATLDDVCPEVEAVPHVVQFRALRTVDLPLTKKVIDSERRDIEMRKEESVRSARQVVTKVIRKDDGSVLCQETTVYVGGKEVDKYNQEPCLHKGPMGFVCEREKGHDGNHAGSQVVKGAIAEQAKLHNAVVSMMDNMATGPDRTVETKTVFVDDGKPLYRETTVSMARKRHQCRRDLETADKYRDAIARAYCHAANMHKVADCQLIESMVKELMEMDGA